MLSPMILGRMIQALEIERRREGAGCCLRPRLCLRRLRTSSVRRSPRSSPTRRWRCGRPSEPGRRRRGRVRSSRAPLDGGYAGDAPYDAILINGSVEARPEALLGQLAEGGRLVCVIGARAFGAGDCLYVRSGDALRRAQPVRRGRAPAGALPSGAPASRSNPFQFLNLS